MSLFSLAGLEELAGAWADAMWWASWQGGLALMVVWLVCRAIPRVSPGVRSWLWRLAYVKLLLSLVWARGVELPVLPSQPPASRSTVSLSEIPDSPDGTAPARGEVAVAVPVPAESALPMPSGTAWTMLLWVFGVGIAIRRSLREHIELRRFVNRSHPLESEEVTSSCAQLCRRMGLRRPPRLRSVATDESPAVAGLRRPTIFLPWSLLRDGTTPEVRLVLAHELAHLKRGDLWWSWLPAVAQWLFWFHPLVWAGGRDWRLAQEMACDEAVLRLATGSVGDYAALLTRFAARRASATVESLSRVGVVEPYHSLKWRLIAMRAWNRRRSWSIALATALAALAGSMGLIPWQVVAQETPEGSWSRRAMTDPVRLAQVRLHKLGRALVMYAADWDGRMPPLDDLLSARRALAPYLEGDTSLFDDPLSGQTFETNITASGKRIPFYRYNPIQVVPLSPYRNLPYDRMQPMNRRAIQIREPWRVAAFYSGRRGGMRAVLFLDGHASVVSDEVWQRIRRDSGISELPPQSRPSGFTGVDELFLLPFPSVQEELRLTGGQKRALDRVMKSPGMTKVQRQTAWQRAIQILSPTQRQRLSQLVLQVNGGPALLRGEVVRALGLAAEQQESIKAVLARYASKEAVLVDQASGAGYSPDQAHAAVRRLPAIRGQAYRAALALLTVPQRARWQQMIGAPWQLKAVIVRG